MTQLAARSRKKQKSKANAAQAIIKSVIRLEKLVWKAAQRRKADAFAKLVPSDAVMIFQSGIMSQPEYLATMHQRTISHYELRKFRGFMPNAKTVILYYEAVRLGEESGNTFPEGRVIESTTWVKRNRRWLAMLNQETHIEAAGTPRRL